MAVFFALVSHVALVILRAFFNILLGNKKPLPSRLSRGHQQVRQFKSGEPHRLRQR
jgi:hypothetical protein